MQTICFNAQEVQPEERVGGIKMKKMVKSEIYYDGEYYCGRCLDFDVFTQGKTLDEVVHHLKEAIQLHFEDDKEYSGRFYTDAITFHYDGFGGNTCLKRCP